jgi:hypothetical protein
MALAAPPIGRWVDRGRAPLVFRAGAILAVAGIALHAAARSLATLYLAWIVLGCAMAALLYETAFGLVIRAFDAADERLRALAAVTVAGGLASTICLPPLALAVERLGWRPAWAAAALAIVVGAVAMELYVFPQLPAAPPRAAAVRPTPPHASDGSVAGRRAPAALALLFASSTFAGMAFSTLLVPLLVERGRSPAVAASALGLLGAMQLPGRIWVLRGGRGGRRLLAGPLVLQVVGLAAVATGASLPFVAVGAAAFGLGAGLHTLARPWIVQELAGVDAAGRWNGQVARIQGLARAGGPVAVAAASTVRGTSAVFALLALLLLLLVPVALILERPSR